MMARIVTSLPLLLLVAVSNGAQASNVRRLTKNKPTGSLPFEVKCSQTIEENVSKLGTIPTIYENLPTCKGFGVDLGKAKASSVFRVRGQNDMFPEIWAKCLAAGNTHDLLLYKRSIKGGQGLVDGWQCVDYKRIVCSKAEDVRAIISTAVPETEYLFVTLHKEIADKVTVGVVCLDLTPSPTKKPTAAPTKKPTKKPTLSPTKKPTSPPKPAREVKCGTTIEEKVKTLGNISPVYEDLPVCKGFTIDLSKVEASSAFTVTGQVGKFPEIWAKCTKAGNTHDLLLFKRPAKVGDGLTEGYQCVDYKRIVCSKAEDLRAITEIASILTDYLFITLHKKLDDQVTVGVACTPSLPVQTPCNDRIVTTTPELGRVGPPFDALGTCASTDVDISAQDYSSAFLVDGDPSGGKTWIVLTCKRVNHSVHYLFSYVRAKGTTSYGCQKVKKITCNRVGKHTRIDQPILEGNEYAFIATGSGSDLLEDVVVTSKCNPTCPKPQIIDFEGLDAGTIVSSLPGVTVTGREKSGELENAAMIFDSDHPTGEDTDLEFNNRGKILILSEDGDANDPDDSNLGGSFFFHFDDPVVMESFILLDGEASEGGSVFLFNFLSQPLFNVNFVGNGDNSQKVIDLGSTPDVKSMVIRLGGSGAIDDIKYGLPC